MTHLYPPKRDLKRDSVKSLCECHVLYHSGHKLPTSPTEQSSISAQFERSMPSNEFIDTYKQASTILYGRSIRVPESFEEWDARIGKPVSGSWIRPTWPPPHQLELNAPLKKAFMEQNGLKTFLQANNASKVFPGDSMVYLLLEMIKNDEIMTITTPTITDICKLQVTVFPREPRRKVLPQQLRKKWADLKKLSEEKNVSRISALNIVARRMNKTSRKFPFFFEYLQPGYLFFADLDNATGIPWHGTILRVVLSFMQHNEKRWERGRRHTDLVAHNVDIDEELCDKRGETAHNTEYRVSSTS